MPFSSNEINIAILQGKSDHPKWLKSQVDDQGVGEIYAPVLPHNITQEAENMLIMDNEKAHLLGNFLKRYFFRETGFVSVI